MIRAGTGSITSNVQKIQYRDGATGGMVVLRRDSAVHSILSHERVAMPRTVLHILWSGTIGGMPRAVYQLARAQRELSNYRPAALFAQSGGLYVERIREAGIEVHQLDLDRDRNLLHSPKVSEILRRYDIHHFHSAELSMMMASLLCRDARRVYTHRGGRARYYGKQGVRYRLAGWMLRYGFHGFSGNTDHAGRAASELLGIDRRRWMTTYNGLVFSTLDAQRPRCDVRRELGIDDSHIVIGTSAALRPWKRIERLVEAFARLDDPRLRLLVLGDGPSRAELVALAARLGVAERTMFTGMKPHVGDYLNVMQMFVLPSDATESFGNSAVEAMYYHLPTIIYDDGGGMLEHIVDGTSGFVVSGVDELAGRIAELADDPALRGTIGETAHEYVTSRYTLEQMIDSYSRLYDHACGGRVEHDGPSAFRAELVEGR